jgi:hypothetical protein
MSTREPRDKKLTDTDKDLIALGAQIERESREEDSDERRWTPAAPFPAASESSEHLRLLIRDEVNQHTGRCERIRQLEKRMDKVDGELREHRDFVNQYLGEKRFVRYVMPLLVGVASSSVAVLLLTLLFRGLAQGAHQP